MNISNHHPEYATTLWGMQAGHLSATPACIAKAEGPAPKTPKETYTPSSTEKGQHHPEYQEYCHYAKSMGYHGC